MKHIIRNEKNPLPLTFKYMDYYRKIETPKIYFLKSKKYQTDFYVRERPLKPLIRLL